MTVSHLCDVSHAVVEQTVASMLSMWHAWDAQSDTHQHIAHASSFLMLLPNVRDTIVRLMVIGLGCVYNACNKLV